MTSQQLGRQFEQVLDYMEANFPIYHFHGFRLGNLFVIYLEN